MIIVEGPDGSGKTTVIERLGYERRSFKALRGGVGSDGQGCWGGTLPAPVAYAQQVLAALEDERKGHAGTCGGQGLEFCDLHIALDRFHLSETVYGPILRGGSGISGDEVVILQRLLNARSVATVLCLPPFTETIRNVERENRPRPEYQTLEFLRKSYVSWEGIKVRGDHYDSFFNYLAKPDGPWIPTWPQCPKDVVGSPTARFLIVGERSNLPIDLPFFSMDGSNGFLNRSLWYARFKESEMAFTNAKTAEGRPRDLRACLLNSTTRVIALGVEARAALVDQDIDRLLPICSVPHPQYWQRFHGTDTHGYAQQLQEIRETAA